MEIELRPLVIALVGSLNHILTTYRGGEVSGTIDDTIRHALTKLSHIHFVGSNTAYKRVLKMVKIKIVFLILVLRY